MYNNSNLDLLRYFFTNNFELTLVSKNGTWNTLINNYLLSIRIQKDIDSFRLIQNVVRNDPVNTMSKNP